MPIFSTWARSQTEARWARERNSSLGSAAEGASGAARALRAERLSVILGDHPGAFFLVMDGPPCQDVSVLNPYRAGARGGRSSLRDVPKEITRFPGETRKYMSMFDGIQFMTADDQK